MYTLQFIKWTFHYALADGVYDVLCFHADMDTLRGRQFLGSLWRTKKHSSETNTCFGAHRQNVHDLESIDLFCVE